MATVTDGGSNTYLIGEKSLDPDSYSEPSDPSDGTAPPYSGHCWHICRWTHPSFYPRQDQAGQSSPYVFGSAHSSGFNMVFCDGSVHSISYSIDPAIHALLGNRHDGQPIDASKF